MAPSGTTSNGTSESDRFPSSWDGQPRQFLRLSRPVELLRHEYDVIVIGSGYGGGVAASRMARAGQSVCVLERGCERWPGEYPATLAETLPQLHISGDFQPDNFSGLQVDTGNPTGLYHLVVGEGQNAFVANGLGGTSLLNANVFIEADKRTLAMQSWPEEIRKSDGLEKYYKRARHMLQPAPYPEQWPQLPKLEMLQRQAKALGLERNFYRVDQTTRFVDGPNNTGVEMRASSLTGMDSTGVNDSSKSSTLVTYISDAWNWGAEIFCQCEVRHILPHPHGGHNVFFAWHGAKRGSFSRNFYEDLMFVHAKEMVFLGAGTLGTTEILLRSREAGLPMSPMLGTGMSGNGDILAFGYNCEQTVNGIGRSNPEPDRPIGPTITGVIDCRDQENPLDGFVIEEGAVPEALVPLLQTMLNIMPGQIHPHLSLIEQVRRNLAGLSSRIIGPYFPNGSVERTQVYLIMSHDSNQAILTLKDGKPVLKFLGVGRSDHVTYLNNLLAKATTAVGGTFVNSPFFAALGQQEITVHPIGGACFSHDGTAATGVTNHIGEVMMDSGSEVHEGLIITDGAVIPTALGANPFATITALAERSVEAAAEKRNLKIDYETKNGLLNLFGPPAYAYPYDNPADEKAEHLIRHTQSVNVQGVEFSEIMSGFIHLSDKANDYNVATKTARSMCQNARFFLSVHSWDLDDLLSSRGHSAMLTGTFIHGALPASPYMCLQGIFQLFNTDSRTPNTTNLTYDFDMVGTDGSVLHFHGFKLVTPAVAGSPLQTWKATSTLYVTVTRLDGSIVGRGTLIIQPSKFGSELATFTPSGAGLISKAFATTRFLSYFVGNVTNVFLGPLGYLQWPSTAYPGYLRKEDPGFVYEVKSSDGIVSTMHYWTPSRDVSTKTTPLLLIPGAAVDQQIFALPTIKENSVEYFTKAGYHVYCLTHRVGKTKTAEQGWTFYDARLDIQAALKKIRSLQYSRKTYVVCHCAGSTAFSSGVLDGTLPASWLAGVTASNVFFNPIFAKINMIKATLPISLPNVYTRLVGKWYSCSSSPNDSLIQQALNQALRLYPVGARSELCNSVVCHRSELTFGRLWSHQNLKEATHANLNHFLGGTSMNALAHLMACGTRGEVLTATPPGGYSLVTPQNLQRFKGVPILFFSGADNAVYSPESTSRSYETLRDLFGPNDYERVVFQNKGHLDCWMSESAKTDVWPRVLAHITNTTKHLEPAVVDNIRASESANHNHDLSVHKRATVAEMKSVISNGEPKKNGLIVSVDEMTGELF